MGWMLRLRLFRVASDKKYVLYGMEKIGDCFLFFSPLFLFSNAMHLLSYLLLLFS